jgi:hypothetical protein
MQQNGGLGPKTGCNGKTAAKTPMGPAQLLRSFQCLQLSLGGFQILNQLHLRPSPALDSLPHHPALPS